MTNIITTGQAPRAADAGQICAILAELEGALNSGDNLNIWEAGIENLVASVDRYLTGEAARLPARVGSPAMRVLAAIPVTWDAAGEATEVIAVIEQDSWPRVDPHYGTIRGYRNDLDDGTVRWSATGGRYDYKDLRAAVRGMASRAGVAVTWPDPDYLDTEAKVLAQRMAEMMWKVATAEDHAIAWSRCPLYKHQEQAFMATVQVAYGCSRLIARRVRDLLSEYGPDDSLQGTTGRGVYSYVQFARANSRSEYHY